MFCIKLYTKLIVDVKNFNLENRRIVFVWKIIWFDVHIKFSKFLFNRYRPKIYANPITVTRIFTNWSMGFTLLFRKPNYIMKINSTTNPITETGVAHTFGHHTVSIKEIFQLSIPQFFHTLECHVEVSYGPLWRKQKRPFLFIRISSRTSFIWCWLCKLLEVSMLYLPHTIGHLLIL